MRVVVDTNVFLAALIVKGNPPDRLYRLWLDKKFEVVTSLWQIEEIKRVSRYPKVQKLLKSYEVGRLINGLKFYTILLEELPEVNRSPDEDDNPLLAMTQAGEAAYLVTGDKNDLLNLKTFQGTQIITARTFVELLDG